jgi:hypothetical protein
MAALREEPFVFLRSGTGLRGAVETAARETAEAATDQVVAVRLRPALRRQVGLVWRAGGHGAPAANAFRKHVTETAARAAAAA